MTITTAPLDLFSTQEQCIDAATNAFKDYRATMEKVVESWLKNELGTIEQLAEAIDRSPKTLKTDYVSALRKQGRLPQAQQGKRSGTSKRQPGTSKNKCRKSGTSVGNSEPEIEQVTVTVDDPPTPTPTPSAPAPTPTPTPKPAPTPTPSVPSAGSSTTRPECWADHPLIEGWTGKLSEVGTAIYKRESVSSRKRVKIANQLAEFKADLERTMRAASNDHKKGGGKILEADVIMVEATLQKEKHPGITETLESVMNEAERIHRFASRALEIFQMKEVSIQRLS